MKTRIIAIIMTVAAFAASFQAKADMRSVLLGGGELPGVTTVTVGKALMKAVGSQNFIGNLDLAGIASGIDKIEVITTDNAKSKKKLWETFQNFIGSQTDYSVLAEVSETADKKGKGENVTVYAKENAANPELLKDVLIVVSEPGEVVFINFLGEFPLQKIMGMMGGDSSSDSDD